MHVFLDAGGGNILAFFELPNSPAMGRDPNTPEWVQHLALKVDSVAELESTKARLEAAGIEVVGITDHAIFKSIYFFDPNGHRVELAADTATPEMSAKLDAVKWEMLDEWSRTLRAPKHAAWMHEREFAAADTPAQR
jgi:catechol-2,3-dioxygenase